MVKKRRRSTKVIPASLSFDQSMDLNSRVEIEDLVDAVLDDHGDEIAEAAYDDMEDVPAKIVQGMKRADRIQEVERFLEDRRNQIAAINRRNSESGNKKRIEAARSKIQEIVAQLLTDGQTISGNAIARAGRLSRKTVQKHSDIWQRPPHE
jgi:DNA-binding NarL/FixJ family response regulator